MGSKNCKGNKDVIEQVVCQNSDLHENVMKAFEIGEEGDQVLLVKQEGKLYAVGNKCTHYGAPLVNGALGKGRVRCPWHGACFNLATGDIEDFPGLDGIPRFQTEVISGGGIKVTANKALLKATRRTRTTCMVARDPKPLQTFVIIGGGAAGNNCAETLRQEGFTGRIVVLAAENYLPYDRIKISKALNVDPAVIRLRSEKFYKEAGIEIMLGVSALKVNTDEKKIKLSNGTNLEYHKLFIATGSRGRRIKMQGSDLENIFTIRNIDDGLAVHQQLAPEKNVVVVGSSFIGMEAAAYCVSKSKSVTVVGQSSLPFEKSFGVIVGQRVKDFYISKGVAFEMNTTVVKYEPKEGDKEVGEVHLRNGKVLPADIVIIGLGTDFNTEFLAGGEINRNMDGGIPVDKYLETNIKGVYAGGDVAYAPVFVNHDKPANIGHWQLAHYHGFVAAYNMIGKSKPLQAVPFFWTVLFGLSFRYTGSSGNYDDVVISGSIDDLKFAGYYCESDTVNAVVTVGADPIASKFAEMLANGKRLKKSQVTVKKVDWFEKFNL